MRRLTRLRRARQRGFTLVELMISLVLVSLVVGLMMQSAVVILGAFREQREAMGLERAARGSIDLIAEAVRNASAGVVTGELRDASSCNPVVGLAVRNSSTGPDAIELMYASGAVVSSIREAVTASSSNLVVVDAAGIAPGDQVILTNGTVGRLLPVTSVDPSGNYWSLGTRTNLCSIAPMPSAGFAPGALVVRAKYARITVETGPDRVPLLTIDPDGDGPRGSEPMAEGIEDLQIAVGVDLDGDGVLRDSGDTADEWFYNAVGDADPPPVTGGRWRALRVTITARDLLPRRESRRPAAEDRAGGSTDAYRRRTLQARIEIRNLGAVE